MKPTDPYDDGVAKGEAEFLHNPGVAHEHDDVNVRGLIAFAAGLAIVTAGVALLMYGVFEGLEYLAKGRDPELSPLAVPAGQEPPAPKLLLDEPLELRLFQAREAQALAGGPDETGAPRMSIEDAMRQIAAEGLPARAEPVDPRTGTGAPSMGESSGGRMLGAPRNAGVGTQK
jgi:hypothetical protein